MQLGCIGQWLVLGTLMLFFLLGYAFFSLPTFFELVGRTWSALDQDLRLADKLGIDSVAFRAALAEHVGVTPDRIAR